MPHNFFAHAGITTVLTLRLCAFSLLRQTYRRISCVRSETQRRPMEARQYTSSVTGYEPRCLKLA